MICCTHVYSALFLKRATLNRNEQVNATMTRKAKITIIIALMLGMALAALDTTIVLTIIGDIFPLEERARVQGLFSGVWGLSSIVGPALGGVIVDHFSWRWVFYINIPFGLLSAFLLIITLKENVERKQRSIDYLGTLTLTFGIIALLFALLQGGVIWAWTSLPSLGLFALAVVLIALFLFQETRASEPILPLTLFSNRIIAISSIGGVVLGVVMFGITSYVPLFVQGVRGGTATSAGVTLGPLLLAWPIAATLSSRIVIRFGYRFTAVIGAIFETMGVGIVALFNVSTGLPLIVVAMLVIGTGLGLMSTAFIISVQNAVPWNVRGVATASTQFFRTIGGSGGVALMGTILHLHNAARLAPTLPT